MTIDANETRTTLHDSRDNAMLNDIRKKCASHKDVESRHKHGLVKTHSETARNLIVDNR
jgi:hypothetical protein